MKKKHSFTGYILILIGIFFLLRQLKIPIITNLYTWQSIVIILGIILLLYSYVKRNGKYTFLGVVLFGVGIHFYGMEHYHFWIDHWGIFLLIIGISFLAKAMITKEGFVLSIFLICLSIFFIYSRELNKYFYWINDIAHFIKSYWSILLIILGIYILRKKK